LYQWRIIFILSRALWKYHFLFNISYHPGFAIKKYFRCFSRHGSCNYCDAIMLSSWGRETIWHQLITLFCAWTRDRKFLNVNWIERHINTKASSLHTLIVLCVRQNVTNTSFIDQNFLYSNNSIHSLSLSYNVSSSNIP
jgi:hypothetical protein